MIHVQSLQRTTNVPSQSLQSKDRAVSIHISSQYRRQGREWQSSWRHLERPRSSQQTCAAGGQQSSPQERETIPTCNVSQSLTLFSLDPEYTGEQISEVIDSTWSLQYMVRGPICGSAGPVLMAMLPHTTEDADQAIVQRYNNCILFRYASESAMSEFMSHGKTKYMLDEISRDKTTHGVVSLTWTVRVPNELEAIFRRGQEWEQGYELCIGLDTSSSEGDDAEEFLELLCHLAVSSAYGAVQATHGTMTGIINHTLHDATGDEQHARMFACDRICMVRFATDEPTVVESFLQSPPMQAIITGDERSPVSLSWGLVQHIVAPPENDSGASSTTM